MIVKEFNIRDLNLNFFVGINQIKFDYHKFLDFYSISNEEKALNHFFEIIEKIQNKNRYSVIQFIKDKYLINQDHVFTACYYVEKAFLHNINISNKKNIELMLYLATNRQISKSIEAFGIELADLIKNELTYCIISPFNNINNINDELSRVLKSEKAEIKINDQAISKINNIKEYFEISDIQLNSVLISYGINPRESKNSLDSQVIVLYDLICEKMALLHIEKIKIR